MEGGRGEEMGKSERRREGTRGVEGISLTLNLLSKSPQILTGDQA